MEGNQGTNPRQPLRGGAITSGYSLPDMETQDTHQDEPTVRPSKWWFLYSYVSYGMLLGAS